MGDQLETSPILSYHNGRWGLRQTPEGHTELWQYTSERWVLMEELTPHALLFTLVTRQQQMGGISETERDVEVAINRAYLEEAALTHEIPTEYTDEYDTCDICDKKYDWGGDEHCTECGHCKEHCTQHEHHTENEN